jgi:hypothetical protein
MIIDTHIHIYGYPSFRDLSRHIRTMEDAIAFRTRYPDLYKCNLTEEPIDNTDDLIADMDRNGVDFALVQARAGYVSNDLVAAAARRHPARMVALARVGHDQEAAGYHEDPGPTREAAPEELERCLGSLGMKGVGETFVRALTDHAPGADPVSDRVVAVSGRSFLRRPAVGGRGRRAASDGARDPHQDGTEHHPLFRRRDDGRDAQRQHLLRRRRHQPSAPAFCD